MIITAIIAALALAQATPASVQTPSPDASPTDLLSQSVALDRTGAPQLTEDQSREVVCPRRAPTGSRLARSWCERRAQAEARSRAARESHEDHILNTGWMDPGVAGDGPL